MNTTLLDGKLTKSYIKAENKNRTETTRTFPSALRHYASIHPDRDAVVFVSTDDLREAVTWNQLYEKSCQVAKCLIQLGVKRHEVVAINIRNCPEWLFLTFGSMLAGAVPISIAFAYKDGHDVLAMMEKLGTCSFAAIDPGPNGDNWIIFKSLIDEYDRNGLVKSAKMPYLRYLICHGCPIDGVKTLTELMLDHIPDVELPVIDPNDIALLLHTSGSTGMPKVVTHTHESVGFVQYEGVGSNDILYNDMPFTWIGGFPVGILIGQTRITQSGFCLPPKDRISFLIEAVKRERCTVLYILPQVIRDLMERQDDEKEDWPIKTIITGGQPISKHLSQCIGTLCEYFVSSYGATECCEVSVNIVNSSDDFIEYSTGNLLKGNEVKVVDDNGEIVPMNTYGEIYARNKGVFKEYRNDPEKTRAVKTADGWYKTGDIGRLTEDGVLFVVSRKSNMITSGGKKVAPEIFETVIKSCPGVDDVVIVPVPDEVQYQLLCACIVIKPGFDVTEEMLRAFCENSNNDNPMLLTILPSYYLFLERFPETRTGKVSRTELTTMATTKFRIK